MTDKLHILAITVAFGLAMSPGLTLAQAADEAPEDASESIAEEAQQQATDGVDSVSEARMLDPEGVLTVGNFDYDSAVATVQASQIPEAEQATLLAGLDAARDDPEALAEVLERIREAIAASR